MKKKNYLFFMFLLFPVFLYSAEKKFDEYSKKNIISFTNHLVQKKDWYRAYLEINRLNIYYNNSITDDEFLISKDYFMFNAGKYKYNKSKSLNSTHLFLLSSKIFAFDSGYNNINLDNNISLNKKYDNMHFFMKKRKFYSFLSCNNYSEANKYLDKHSKLEKYKYLITYSEKQKKLLKNSSKALLVGVLPGMGYTYADNKNTGITAFLVVAVNAVLTVFAFKTGNEPIGMITGSIGTFFYGGSIIGGYLETKKYNKTIKTNTAEYLREQMNFKKDRKLIYNKYGIGKYEKK